MGSAGSREGSRLPGLCFSLPLHFVLPGVRTPPVPNHKPHPAAVTAGGDTESPAQHLQASAVMRISPHTTPKPTCKAEFPRGKKTYAQAAHIPPPRRLSATSGLTCSSSLPAGLSAPKSQSCHSTLDPTFTAALGPVYRAPSTGVLLQDRLRAGLITKQTSNNCLLMRLCSVPKDLALR